MTDHQSFAHAKCTCIRDNGFELVNNVKLVNIKGDFMTKGRCLVESDNLRVSTSYENDDMSTYPDEFIRKVTLVWVKLSCNCKPSGTVRLKTEA